MKVVLEFDIQGDSEDTNEHVQDALNGYKYKAILWELLHNKRKEIIEWKFEDNGMAAQAEEAEAVFDAIREELETMGLLDALQ